MTDIERKHIFSRNLLHILEVNKKTQKEVADSIGVSQQTFNTWCRGVAIPRMGKIQLLADYFKINMSDLIEIPLPDSLVFTEEAELVSIYRSFSSEGREKLLEYARLLQRDGSYIKNSTDNVV